jgi:hypothetical protein
MAVKYLYTWHWNASTGEYAISRVTEDNRKHGNPHFNSFEEAKNNLMQHWRDCIQQAFDEIGRLYEYDIPTFEEQLQKAKAITKWTE